ncbi:MAG: ComF family protein [Firmicutes bacterium]|nr:ComF family protein [Bacillota bacterium]MCL5040260.1 ComF family protein [Bacillota bacterium]
MALLEGFLELLFADRRCLFCQARVAPGQYWCPACWEETKTAPFPFSPEGISSADTGLSGSGIEIYSVGLYEGKLRRALLALKYSGREYLARGLGEMLFLFAREADLTADLVLPVPLHPRRQRQRGFNQAEALARVVAGGLGVELGRGLLRRRRETLPQSSLGKSERLRNVQGAFFVTGGVELDLKRILLVDDIFTTGATLQECANVLGQAGAGQVEALTVARGR